MPAKRKLGDDVKPSTPKKVKPEAEMDEGAGADVGEIKNGPFTAEEEKFVLLSALAECDFKLSKTFQNNMAAKLNRTPKSILNFWYRRVLKEIKELQGECGEPGAAEEGDKEEGEQ